MSDENGACHSRKVPRIAATLRATELLHAMLRDGGLVTPDWKPGPGVSAWLLKVAQEEWDWIAEAARHASAVRTLERLGYVNKGGEFWEPPLGLTSERRRAIGDALHRVIHGMARRADEWTQAHPEDAYAILPMMEDAEELEAALRYVDPTHPAGELPSVIPALGVPEAPAPILGIARTHMTIEDTESVVEFATALLAEAQRMHRVLDEFERKERGIPQAHMAAALVSELRAAIDTPGVGGTDGR